MSVYQPRSAASQAAYEAFKSKHSSAAIDLGKETILRDLRHWVIIENRFPYDNMARTNHLLISKEPINALRSAPTAVREEFDALMQEIATQGTYDARIENFPQVSTVKKQYHVHLICWHNTA